MQVVAGIALRCSSTRLAVALAAYGIAGSSFRTDSALALFAITGHVTETDHATIARPTRVPLPARTLTGHSVALLAFRTVRIAVARWKGKPRVNQFRRYSMSLSFELTFAVQCGGIPVMQWPAVLAAKSFRVALAFQAVARDVVAGTAFAVAGLAATPELERITVIKIVAPETELYH